MSYYMLLDFHVKIETRFSHRDKRLFQISEVEIAKIGCIWIYFIVTGNCHTFRGDSINIALLPSDKWSALKGNNLLPLGTNSFLSEQ